MGKLDPYDAQKLKYPFGSDSPAGLADQVQRHINDMGDNQKKILMHKLQIVGASALTLGGALSLNPWVAGTGMANMARNMYQASLYRGSSLNIAQNEQPDGDKAQDEPSKKDLKANSLSIGTNLPQFAGGIGMMDPATLAPAAAAVVAYSSRATSNLTSLFNKKVHPSQDNGLQPDAKNTLTKGETPFHDVPAHDHSKPAQHVGLGQKMLEFNERFVEKGGPGTFMTGRGLLQTAAGIAAFATGASPLVALALVTSGAGFTAGAMVMREIDRRKNDEGPETQAQQNNETKLDTGWQYAGREESAQNQQDSRKSVPRYYKMPRHDTAALT